MTKINKGDKIYSNTSQNFHTVDGIEYIEGYKLVFTEDLKCFPIQEVRKCIDSCYDYLEKKFRKEDITEKEYDYFIKSFSEKLNNPIYLYDVDLYCDTGLLIKRSPTY